MVMPFGFGGFRQSNAQMTPQQKRQRESNMLRRGIQGGINSGDTFGPIMGFMGLPWLTRGSDRMGDYNGPPRMVSAFDFLGGGLGGRRGGGNQPQIEDPPLPPLDDPNDPNGNGGGGPAPNGGWKPIDLLYPPPIGTGAQWRNTMKYGA